MGVDTLVLINRRERQILVHSCLYYQFNENLIQDHVYDAWSKELVELIQTHKEEFKRSVSTQLSKTMTVAADLTYRSVIQGLLGLLNHYCITDIRRK